MAILWLVLVRGGTGAGGAAVGEEARAYLKSTLSKRTTVS